MKSDIEIVDDIYEHLKGSVLEGEIGGRLLKDEKLHVPGSEDVCISVLASETVNDVQEAYINVNIYVRDIKAEGKMFENRQRLGELAVNARDVLKVGGIGKDYTFHLVNRQGVYKVPDNEGKPEHYLNNKLFYQIISD